LLPVSLQRVRLTFMSRSSEWYHNSSASGDDRWRQASSDDCDSKWCSWKDYGGWQAESVSEWGKSDAWGDHVWKSQDDVEKCVLVENSSSSSWQEPQTSCRLSERQKWDVSSASTAMPDIAQRKVLVIGDSVMRGLEKPFQTRCANKDWRVDANQGKEALSVVYPPEELQLYDHIFYCSAGNAIWSGEKEWSAVERHLRSLDPRKTSVVLLGSAEFWSKVAGPAYKVKRPSFFEDVKSVLLDQKVHMVELRGFMESLEYADEEGHPSKKARLELVPKLLEVFRDLAEQVERKAGC